MADDILRRLVHVARPIILEYYRPDSCIASTRIAIEVLGYFGVRAQPLPVKAQVYNKKAADHVRAGDLEGDGKSMKDYTEDGSWAVGLGYPEPDGKEDPSKWVGHLVAITADAVVDLSLDQAARPHKDIEVGPSLLPLRALEGDPLVSETGVVLIYEPDPGNVRYREANDWKIESRWRPVAARIIREMKKEVAHGD